MQQNTTLNFLQTTQANTLQEIRDIHSNLNSRILNVFCVTIQSSSNQTIHTSLNRTVCISHTSSTLTFQTKIYITNKNEEYSEYIKIRVINKNLMSFQRWRNKIFSKKQTKNISINTPRNKMIDITFNHQKRETTDFYTLSYTHNHAISRRNDYSYEKRTH